MNDDDPAQHLAELRTEHRLLDAAIEAMRLDPRADQLEIARMKKRKLRLKDEIALLADRSIPDLLA